MFICTQMLLVSAVMWGAVLVLVPIIFGEMLTFFWDAVKGQIKEKVNKWKRNIGKRFGGR